MTCKARTRQQRVFTTARSASHASGHRILAIGYCLLAVQITVGRGERDRRRGTGHGGQRAGVARLGHARLEVVQELVAHGHVLVNLLHRLPELQRRRRRAAGALFAA